MKILVLQYDMQKDGGVVLPSHMGRDIEIILPQGVDHIIIEKEEIAPKTVSRCNVASADFGCFSSPTAPPNIQSLIQCSFHLIFLRKV